MSLNLIKVFKSQKNPSSDIMLFDSLNMVKIFEAKHDDFELTTDAVVSARMELFLNALKEGLIIKFHSKSDICFDVDENYCERALAIAKIGYKKRNLLISVQKSIPKLKKQGFDLLKSFNKGSDNYEEYALDFDQGFDDKIFKLLNLDLKPINFENRDGKFNNFHHNLIDGSYEIKAASCGLRLDDEFVSIIKLQKLSTNPLSASEIVHLRESLPHPNEITFSVEKLDERSSQLLLKVKSKQEENVNDIVSASKKEESDLARAEIILQGKKLFKMEFTIVLRSFDQEELSASAKFVKREFKRLGDFEIETFGAYDSYLASQIGGNLHVTNYELIDRLHFYLPTNIFGNDRELATNSLAFHFHRQDASIDFLDPFNKHYSNQSGIVIGKSGRGKSVFVNNLLRCLDFDEKASILIVDVKGSHTNTVEMLGGTRHEISATSPCGISPFEFLRIRQDHSVSEIILDFLEKIMLEDGELSLSRYEQAQIEVEFMSYISSNPRDPSIDDFLKFSKNIPRREALQRWQKTGLYGKLFSPLELSSKMKIQYFDFKDILTASKGVVSTAVMSAIMAHFNFRLLDKKSDEKLIFIADETPFFIRNCFSSFNLLQKNLRKLGGSQILVAQNLSDLVVGGDTSLVNQTEFKVFFSTDEGSKTFKEVSMLSDDAIKRLNDFNVKKGKYSEFILKDTLGERTGRLILSKEEYLRASTLPNDVTKIEKFQNALEIKDKNLAIEILANIQEEYAI